MDRDSATSALSPESVHALSQMAADPPRSPLISIHGPDGAADLAAAALATMLAPDPVDVRVVAPTTARWSVEELDAALVVLETTPSGGRGAVALQDADSISKQASDRLLLRCEDTAGLWWVILATSDPQHLSVPLRSRTAMSIAVTATAPHELSAVLGDPDLAAMASAWAPLAAAVLADPTLASSLAGALDLHRADPSSGDGPHHAARRALDAIDRLATAVASSTAITKPAAMRRLTREALSGLLADDRDALARADTRAAHTAAITAIAAIDLALELLALNGDPLVALSLVFTSRPASS